jgi:hypothetical protein
LAHFKYFFCKGLASIKILFQIYREVKIINNDKYKKGGLFLIITKYNNRTTTNSLNSMENY